LITLYTDQSDFVENTQAAILSGHKKLICQMATGGGKTVIFCHLIKQSILKKGGFVTVLVHRSELAGQTVLTLQKLGIKAAAITSNGTEIINSKGEFEVIHKHVKSGFQAYVCMVETLHGRKAKGLSSYRNLLEGANFVIADEGHYTIFVKVLDDIPKNKVTLLFTATPLFATKKHKITDYHTELIQGLPPSELIELGRLVAPIYYPNPVDLSGVKIKNGEYDSKAVVKQYDRQSILNSVLLNYNKYQKGEKTVIFTSSIEYAKRVEVFLLENGLNVKSIDSDTATPESRKEVFSWLRNTDDAILVNVGIATTGTDIPDLRNIILLRATTSLTLYLQMIGRGARTSPNKAHFNVFDYGNNKERLGRWEEYRDWKALIEEAERPKKAREVDDLGLQVVTLPSLFAGSNEGDKSGLILLEPDGSISQKWEYLLYKSVSRMTITELEACRRIKKYKAGWLYRQIYANWGEIGLEAYSEIMNFKPGWINTTIKRLSL
jgi:superfamily II DNA or RNA helicase